MKKPLNTAFHSALPALLCLTLASSCSNPNQGNDKDEAAGADSLMEEVPSTLSQVWKTDSSLTGSESTLYDPDKDIIYVSCGNTDAGAKDEDGFIALLNTDGSVETLKWVSGLHAPKGMTLLNGKLYVTDIDEVKIIDIEKAVVEKTIPVEGAVFLNDLANDGSVTYFSDSRTGTVYSLNQEGTVQPVITGAEGINGLECYEGSLYTLDKAGLKRYEIPGYAPELIDTVVKGGDGLVILNDTTFIASRWAGEIYLIRGNEAGLLVDTKAEESNTADIGFVPDRNLVVVPTFLKNEVAGYELK